MKNKTIYFDEVRDFNRLKNCTEKVEIALSRLENLQGIDDEKVIMYQSYLFSEAPAVITQFIDLNRKAIFPLLVKHRVIRKSNVIDFIDYARDKKKTDILFYLMDAGNSMRSNPKSLNIFKKHTRGRPLPDCHTDYSRAKEGDILWLGAVPMPWQVLENKDKKLLLISKYVIDCLPFETFYYGLTDYICWQDSTIRYKLNTIYLPDLFTEEERGKIVPVYIDRQDNLYFSPVENTTRDSLFFLSVKEAQKYIKGEKERLAPITRYANRSMLWTLFDQYAHWWLRTDGRLTADKYYVRDGVIMSENSTVSGGRFEHFGVRPAMYFRYE